MVATCHLCGSRVALGDNRPDGLVRGFECADCGNVTCIGCKSIGVGRQSEHCERCRG